jgi:transcription elongation factor Elf1
MNNNLDYVFSKSCKYTENFTQPKLNYEGCGCPWCNHVTMVLIDAHDKSVIGTCNECGKLYRAQPHPDYNGIGILMSKVTDDELKNLINNESD